MHKKYARPIKTKDGLVYPYRVTRAFEVTEPEIAHAIKKLLCSGTRGHKDKLTDWREAIESIGLAIEFETQE